MSDLGYWVISGEALMEMLHQAHLSGDPEQVYIDHHYANAEDHKWHSPRVDKRRKRLYETSRQPDSTGWFSRVFDFMTTRSPHWTQPKDKR